MIPIRISTCGLTQVSCVNAARLNVKPATGRIFNLLYDNSTRQYKTLKMDITHVNIIEFLFGLLSLIGGLMVGTVIWIIKDFHTRINTSEEKANGLYSAYLIAHGKLEERVKECEVFVDGIQKSYLVLRRD